MSEARAQNQQKVFDRLAKRFEGKIRSTFSANDQEAVNDFLSKAFGSNSIQNSMSYNEWLFKMNTTNSQLIAWDGGEVSGCQSGLSCTFTSPGGELNGTWAIDLSVRDDWKMKGLGVALIKKLMDNNELVMGLGISPSAQAMFKRLGWKDMGQTNRYIKPLSSAGFSNLQQDNKLKKSILFPLAAWGVRLVTKLRLLFEDSYSVKSISNFESCEQELDIITSKQKRASHLICTKKNASYLQWRFLNSPSKNNPYNINLLYKDKTPHAYVVSKIAIWEEKKVLVICDYLGGKDCYSSIIKTLEAQALEAGVDAIIYQGIDTEFEAQLRKSLFVKRPHGDIFMIYCNESISGRDLILDISNWHITFSDSDTDFIFFN